MKALHERLGRRDRRRRHGRRQLRARAARHEVCACCSSKACRRIPRRNPASMNAPRRSATARGRFSNPWACWQAMAADVGADPLHSCLRCRPLRRRAARCAASRACLPSATSCRIASSAASLWQALREAPNVDARRAGAVEERDAARRRRAARRRQRRRARKQVRAAVAVAADGAGSVLRASAGIEADVEDYDQVAIVVNAATETAQQGRGLRTLHRVRAARGAAGDRRRLCRRLGRAPRARRGADGARRSRLRRRTAHRVRLARRPLDAHRPPQHLSARAVARRGNRGRPRGAHRQCRAGAAPGGGPGFQPRTARCGDAGRDAGERRRVPTSRPTSPSC